MKLLLLPSSQRRLKWLVGVCAGLASMVGLAQPLPAEVAGKTCLSVSPETCRFAQSLKRGINLGNMLEAPREGDWGVKAEPRFIELAASNFNTVRLPVRWTNHAAATADAALDEAFAKRVDVVVDALLAKGLNVILDLHHYNQLFGDALHPNEFAVDPQILEARLINIWRQVAYRYKDRPARLAFELLNEPHGKLSSDAWNELIPKLLAVVRQSNPGRAVLVGPTYWNAVRDLPKLKLPPDRNIVVTIHNYDPLGFTHQGVRWIPVAQPVGTPCCDDDQKALITSALDKAKAWSDQNGYPIHLGEFGTVLKAPMESRVAYSRFVRDQAEARGFSWTYWELASDFGVYDPKANQWIEPLRRALLD